MTGEQEAAGFTHLDDRGRARMVNVGGKEVSVRRAVARARVQMDPATAQAIADQAVAKGDVLAVARIAGIQAAKRTSEAIPLCHPLMLSAVDVECTVGNASVDIEAWVEVTDRTGVEMEALHACTVAALTVYDMCKALDKNMVISDVALWEKTGGRSGPYRRL